MFEIKKWKHVFKLDPNKEITDGDLEKICESGTDAVLIGGSDGITEDNVLSMLARVRRFSVPCVLEVSTIDSITPGYDFYFVPTVLNSRERKWIIDVQHDALMEFGDIMNWDEIITEGYCILNGDSKAASLTNSKTDLTEDEVIAYARMADKLFKLPIFYLEYSGIYGDPLLVSKVKDTLEHTQLFYGGGIATVEQAIEMAKIAHTIVVGNVIYENLNLSLIHI